MCTTACVGRCAWSCIVLSLQLTRLACLALYLPLRTPCAQNPTNIIGTYNVIEASAPCLAGWGAASLWWASHASVQCARNHATHRHGERGEWGVLGVLVCWFRETCGLMDVQLGSNAACVTRTCATVCIDEIFFAVQIIMLLDAQQAIRCTSTVARCMIASSGKIYSGYKGVTPITPATAGNPRCWYSATKLLAESGAEILAYATDLEGGRRVKVRLGNQRSCGGTVAAGGVGTVLCFLLLHVFARLPCCGSHAVAPMLWLPCCAHGFFRFRVWLE